MGIGLGWMLGFKGGGKGNSTRRNGTEKRGEETTHTFDLRYFVSFLKFIDENHKIQISEFKKTGSE